MIKQNHHKSRPKIGKEAEKLALRYLTNLYPSANITPSSKGQACDYFIKLTASFLKVEVKSCSNNGRFMIHDYQLEALKNEQNSDNLENLWIFVWFKGSQELIRLVKFSRLKELLSDVPLRKCMTGYSKFIDMNKREYQENKNLIVKKFTIREISNGKRLYKVKFKRYGYLYNISPSRIFDENKQ